MNKLGFFLIFPLLLSCKRENITTVEHYKSISIPSYQFSEKDSLGQIICIKKNGIISNLYIKHGDHVYKDSFWEKKGCYVRYDSITDGGTTIKYYLVQEPCDKYLLRYWLQQKRSGYELVALDSVRENWTFVRRFYPRDRLLINNLNQFMALPEQEKLCFDNSWWSFTFLKKDSSVSIKVWMEGTSSYNTGELAGAEIKSMDETFYVALLNFESQLPYFPYIPIASSRL